MRLPCVTEGAFQIVGGKQVACREWTFVLREHSLQSACADAILSRQKLLKAVVETRWQDPFLFSSFSLNSCIFSLRSLTTSTSASISETVGSFTVSGAFDRTEHVRVP
ncbi:hypothetical protein LR48_Vigan432s002900 [Vigna angularis]|uniref:Uncharacterized protein n=1 Tax=Phaseolus angularis TaxID=3914 RepID=A0A0L9TBN4_PHAAN|nr:hypothetical protein LR48_Vigan432s002900 [Vigna angularis]